MNYATIKSRDVANGTGVRVSVFVSGCTHHCPDCFNREAWDFDYGEKFTDATIDEIIKLAQPDYISGLSLLGGEPFEMQNQEGLLPLLQKFADTYPKKDVWCYTGYLFEDILSGKVGEKQTAVDMLNHIDILVDGRFEKQLKNLNLKFKGSENQRIIDVKQSIALQKIVLWYGDLENLSKNRVLKNVDKC